MTRVAKHSSQTFNINTRNNHIKAYFIVIVGGVLEYVTLP